MENSPRFRKENYRNFETVEIHHRQAAGQSHFEDFKKRPVIRARLLSMGLDVKQWLRRERGFSVLSIVEVVDKDTREPRGFREVGHRNGNWIVRRPKMSTVLRLIQAARVIARKVAG